LIFDVFGMGKPSENGGCSMIVIGFFMFFQVIWLLRNSSSPQSEHCSRGVHWAVTQFTPAVTQQRSVGNLQTLWGRHHRTSILEILLGICAGTTPYIERISQVEKKIECEEKTISNQA
jgi:hypothetical protein